MYNIITIHIFMVVNLKFTIDSHTSKKIYKQVNKKLIMNLLSNS